MTTTEFLREIRRRGVDVWLADGRVRCGAAPGLLTPDLRAELARRKPEIEALLRAARTAADGPVVPIERGGSRPPFYAVPGHNGDVFCFVRLARALGREYPFYGLRPPGLDDDGPPLDRIEDLAAWFADAIVRRHPGPYYIGGYCLGGLTAFEMARRLRAMGHEVGLLVMFGTMSPPALRPLNRAYGAASWWIRDRVQRVRNLATLPAAERAARIRARLAVQDTARAPRGDEASRRRRLVEQATVSAAHRYRAMPYDGPMTFFAANEAATHSPDRPLAWAGYASGFDLFCGPRECDGDTMLKEGAAPVFAAELARRLDAVADASSVAPAGAETVCHP